MSQHDFNIANQGFPSFRADLNDGLVALATNSAGSTEPSTTFAYQFWYDESADLLKMRNGDDDAWITLAAFDQTTDEWEVRSAVIQAVDAAGVEIKTDDGTTRLDIADDGTVTIPGDFVVQGTVTGIATNIISEGNSSVAVSDSGTGLISNTVDGTERMRVTTSGVKVNKTIRLDNENAGVSDGDIFGDIEFFDNDAGSGPAGVTAKIEAEATGPFGASLVNFYTSASSGGSRQALTKGMQLDANGFLKFDSGYGSVATAYGCRAWVNFDGTGTVSIRGSGNVSSITDNGTGIYTVNFTTAMPDVNYAINLTTENNSLINLAFGNFPTLTSFRIDLKDLNGSNTDRDPIFATVFR